MNKKYAIFDMDGTLIDSMGYWQNLGREFLMDNGITSDQTALYKKIEALTMSDAARLFREYFHLEMQPEEIVADLLERMNRHYENDIPLKSKVKEYLDRLKEQGVHMCIASATAEPLVKTCMERLGVYSYFDFILSCETLKVSKKNPDIYLEAAKRFGKEPEEIAVYEDAYYAAKTAKDAGFYLIGVYEKVGDELWPEIQKLADATLDFY